MSSALPQVSSPDWMKTTSSSTARLQLARRQFGFCGARPQIRQWVGLHFAGVFRDTNYAVAAAFIWAALARTRPRRQHERIAACRRGAPPASSARRSLQWPAGLRSPTSPEWGEAFGSAARAQPVGERRRAGGGHRRCRACATSIFRWFESIDGCRWSLPVNIDGEKQRKLDREGDWKLDARLHGCRPGRQ